MNIKELINQKNYVVSSIFIKAANLAKLSLDEFLILLYFDNLSTKEFDLSALKLILDKDEQSILLIFNQLLAKKLISVDVVQSNKVMKEIINMEPFYALVSGNVTKNDETSDIYEMFEKEFARPLSSMEFEIIKAWIASGFEDVLIKEALKEAVYNGALNLRYIDKILFEWKKKGINNPADLKLTHKQNSKVKKDTELFDYDWLDDDE